MADAIANLEKLAVEIEKFNYALDNIGDIELGDLVSKDVKLTKKQRLEEGRRLLKLKMPAIHQLLFETDLIGEAISARVTELKDQLEEMQSDLEDLEISKEDIQSRLNDLGM
jgi:hypothetical protein